MYTDTTTTTSPSAPVDIADQRREIDEERYVRAAARNEDTSREILTAVPAHVRFSALMAEGWRRESCRVRSLATTGAIPAHHADALLHDLRMSYTALSKEVRKVLAERQPRYNNGVSAPELQQIVNQAVGCLASVYPWSMTILSSEVNPFDTPFQAVANRGNACLGESGNVVILSLAATGLCAQRRCELTSIRKNDILRSAVARLDAIKEEEQVALLRTKNTDLLLPSSSTAGGDHTMEDGSCSPATSCGESNHTLEEEDDRTSLDDSPTPSLSPTASNHDHIDCDTYEDDDSSLLILRQETCIFQEDSSSSVPPSTKSHLVW